MLRWRNRTSTIDTRDDVLPTIDRERSVAFTKTGVVREWSPSRRSTLTHFPGPWREERYEGCLRAEADPGGGGGGGGGGAMEAVAPPPPPLSDK